MKKLYMGLVDTEAEIQKPPFTIYLDEMSKEDLEDKVFEIIDELYDGGEDDSDEY